MRTPEQLHSTSDFPHLQIKAILTKYEISPRYFARAMGISYTSDRIQPLTATLTNRIRAFNTIKIVEPDYPQGNFLIFLDPENQFRREITNTFEETEKKWLRTIKDIPFTTALKFLRLSQHTTQQKLQKKIKTIQTIARNEIGIKTPLAYTINQLAETADLNPYGPVAQLLQLQRKNKEVMSLEELKKCQLGKIIHYLRLAQGTPTKELGEQIGISRAAYQAWEQGQSFPTQNNLDKLIECFGINPESSLAKILKQKGSKLDAPISDKTLLEVLTDQYLFSEHLLLIEPYPISNEEQELLTQAHNIKYEGESTSYKNSVSTLLKLVRTKKSLSQRAISIGADISYDNYNRIENGKKLPTDLVIVKIMEGLGYDIHHPLTHLILYCTAEEKRLKKSGDIFVASNRA